MDLLESLQGVRNQGVKELNILPLILYVLLLLNIKIYI